MLWHYLMGLRLEDCLTSVSIPTSFAALVHTEMCMGLIRTSKTFDKHQKRWINFFFTANSSVSVAMLTATLAMREVLADSAGGLSSIASEPRVIKCLLPS